MTETKQPTQEQIKEILQWIGFTSYYEVVSDEARDSGIIAWIQPPDSEKTIAYYGLTLDFLFKYAVPKLTELNLRVWNGSTYRAKFRAEVWNRQRYIAGLTGIVREDNNDPALALFWAIWEVING